MSAGSPGAQQSPFPGQGVYPEQHLHNIPMGSQGASLYPPGQAPPSDSNPMSYQSMLDSMPSAQGSGSNVGGPIRYPEIQGGVPSERVGQNVNPAPGHVGQSTGKAQGFSYACSIQATDHEKRRPTQVFTRL